MRTEAVSEVPEEGKEHGEGTEHRTAQINCSPKQQPGSRQKPDICKWQTAPGERAGYKRLLSGACKADRTPPQTAHKAPPPDDGCFCSRGAAWLRGQRQEYAEQGLAYLESQDYAQAVTAFDDAIALAHGRIGAFESQMLLYRAEAQYRSGDYQSALASYETLYAKDESNEACKTGLSLCLLETGDYDRAKSLGVILGQVYSRIARDQINAGQYDEALSTIDTGLAEAGADDVGREELTFNQAVAWEYKGDYKKALEILESYGQKYTAEGNAARELAFLKTRQGNR